MNAVDLLQRLHQHRAWVNGNLLTAAATLSDEQLRSPFQIGQGSIWKSLVHLYAAEYVWLEALLGQRRPRSCQATCRANSQAISKARAGSRAWTTCGRSGSALEQRWIGYLASLTPESLEEVVYKKGSVTGQRFGTRRADVLLHVCTHAHYTAAQVVNMLRQAGVEKLPETMLISLARHEAT